MKIKIGPLLMVLGALLLTGAFGLTAYNRWDENRAGDSVKKTVQVLRTRTPDLHVLDPEGELIPNYILDPEREMPIIEIDGNEYVGFLDIPVLDLSLPVMAEWSYPNLKISPCRLTGSVYRDDMVICAHNYERHFGRIKTLVVGDEVRFTDGDGNVFNYEVLSLETLNPTQVEEMTEGGGGNLTLFTCTIGGAQRVTVRCVRVSEELVV